MFTCGNARYDCDIVYAQWLRNVKLKPFNDQFLPLIFSGPKRYPPNKPTLKNQVQKLDPENWLIRPKIRYFDKLFTIKFIFSS